eukprot:TRINITY_DN2071_c0_g2_i4.p1 TRINITY_DN2071_c0_g2~~TRINITY_DN2071_c0_g2_i4.p1  ORF type:complete len:393 (+),score=117.44 TRINITY_DN2071_c0_g2_i4:528-1706(+)
MERRRSSIANESDLFSMRKTDEQLEAGRAVPRRGSIVPFELDADGFKRPRELRAEAEDLSRLVLRDPSFPVRLASPSIQPEEKKEGFRAITSLKDAAFSPMLIKTPLMSSIDGMQWIQQPYNYPMEPPRKNSKHIHPSAPDNLSNYFSPFVHPSPIPNQMQQCSGQDGFRLDGGELGERCGTAAREPMVGMLTAKERKEKIRKYREKRKQRIWKKKVSYDCRKKVADKRLRIKGRFVTREQAYAILGTTAEDLASNELLRTLITNSDNCSIVTSAQNMKIRNIQTLLAAPEKTKILKEDDRQLEARKDSAKVGNELRVEILKKNSREHVVEIKIESLAKSSEDTNQGLGQVQQRKELPKINNPIFQFKRLGAGEVSAEHCKYHKDLLCSNNV